MDPLHSPSWYRVAQLRPCLGAAVRFLRHPVRGETWYVGRSPATGRVHRLTPAAHVFVSRMDGAQTTHELWEALVAQWGDEAPTQDECLRVLAQLHGAGMLHCDVPADTAVLFRRAAEEERLERRSRRNPLSLRVPLLDPDAFLTRWEPWISPLFSRTGGWVWCAVMLAAGVSALRHAPELAAAARAPLDPAQILVLWFTYPVVKALHELGHAFAVKRWGGEVHEIGILFLVLLPAPYVDASAAAVFPEKRRRIAVGAAGIAVELLLAALASFVWLAVEPGLVRHVAYATMLVGGVSTLFFNGNPLLRFDGYFVLCDAIEIPNLASRSNAYLGALARRWLLGLRNTVLPETAPGEAPWLVGYGIASFLYGLAVLLAIALFLAKRFFFLGVALAIFALAVRVALPLLRQLQWLLTDPIVGEHRGRALGGSLGLAALLTLLLLAVPLPLRTRSTGVVWLPEQSQVRAGAEGFVVEVLAQPQTFVHAGTPLLRTRDPGIETRVRVLEAERRERRLRVPALAPDKRVEIELANARLAESEAELARAQERASEVVIRSPCDGTFVVSGREDLIGRFVRQGDVVAHVVDLRTATVRVVVPQEDVALLRERPRAAWVRLAHDLATVLPAQIVRQVPAATDQLPSRALGTAAGGPFAIDPEDEEGLRTREKVFQFELSLPTEVMLPVAGERAQVRFDHGAEPVAWRAYRAVQRLFLRQLGV